METSAQVELLLDQLVAMAIFGATRADVAEFLVCEGIRRLIGEGLLKPHYGDANI